MSEKCMLYMRHMVNTVTSHSFKNTHMNISDVSLYRWSSYNNKNPSQGNFMERKDDINLPRNIPYILSHSNLSFTHCK